MLFLRHYLYLIIFLVIFYAYKTTIQERYEVDYLYKDNDAITSDIFFYKRK